MLSVADIKRTSNNSRDRYDLAIQLLRGQDIHCLAEIGVWKGDFAARILTECPNISRYIMVDPWRPLDRWNKPSNVSAAKFTQIYDEAMEKTRFAEERRVVLRAKTVEVTSRIPDHSLDAVYIDGDHTLRGITTDPICLFNKVRPGGMILGDDFCHNIWQHPKNFEPTFVFPFAVYFAEIKNVPIFGLPYNQFLILTSPESGFAFHDLTGLYHATDVGAQLKNAGPSLRKRMRRRVRALVARLQRPLSSL